jgi:hypothetical protein
MNIQEIESAVLKQLPFRKQHLPVSGLVTKDFSPQNILVIICGLASVYLPEPRKKIVEFYDITPKVYDLYIKDFYSHLDRVNEVIRMYGVKGYKEFSEAFWVRHNPECMGEKYKSGTILSHILSSKREFREFVREDNVFREGDFTSFFVYNKSQLTKNFLNLYSKKHYVDFLEMAY